MFLVLRRDPEADEIFTVWLIRKDWPAIFATLRRDSGPPLYYLLANAMPAAWQTVAGVRAISLVAAAAALFLIMRTAGTFAGAAASGILIAVYPLHLYFSSVARTYALVALLIGCAVVACDRWAERERRNDLVVACAAILAAAYCHYYGVYFFPLPLAIALFTRRSLLRDGLFASAALGVAFVPGFLLMKAQPAQIIAWMRLDDDFLRLSMVAQSVTRIGFDGRQPLPFASSAIRICSVALFLAALVAGRKSQRALRFLLAIVIPMAGALFAAAIGMTAYFPLRFESVLSVPVVLGFWFSAAALGKRYRFAMLLAACVIGALASISLMTRDWRNTSDIYRAALFARDRVDPRLRIVATGGAYLEAAAISGRDLIAFPSRHAIQPWDPVPEPELQRDVARLPRTFLWIGDQRDRSIDVLRRGYKTSPVARFGNVIAVSCERIPLAASRLRS